MKLKIEKQDPDPPTRKKYQKQRKPNKQEY